MSFYVNTSAKAHTRARSRLTTTVEPCEDGIDNNVLPAAPVGVDLDPSEDRPQRRLFASVPDVEYDYKAVVGSGYIGAPVAENYRLRVRFADCLMAPERVHNWTKKIPQGLGKNWKKLTDLENPEHLEPVDDCPYKCRWCGMPVANKSNQYRHERKCTKAGAPGHVCNAKKMKCGLDCPGTGTFTPDEDYRVGNKLGTLGRPKTK